MNDYSDAIGWPTKDPQWISKIVIQGLIYIIPIVGWIALIGWMLAGLDNLRQGRRELPAAGFTHLGRGVTLFLVLLVYGLAIAAVFGVLLVVAFVLIAAGSNNNVGVLGALGGILLVLAYGLLLVLGVGLYFAMAPIILATERGGFGAGVNFPQVWAMVRSQPSGTLFAGLFILVGHLIGSLGSILCGIGVFVTIAYGYAVMAGVVSVFEQQLQPSAPRLDQTGGHA